MSRSEKDDLDSEGVEFIHEGGEGSEARVDVELRTRFPGIGGTIDTYQGIAVAEETNSAEHLTLVMRCF